MDVKNENVLKNEKTLDGTTRQKVREIFMGILYAVSAFVIGGAEFLFGARPFGVALLCASRTRVWYIYTGLALSSFLSPAPNSFLILATYTVLLFVRIVSRMLVDNPLTRAEWQEGGIGAFYGILFSEHILLRMTTAALGGFSLGMLSLVSGGFMFYDLYGIIVSMALSPLATFLLSGLFEDDLGDGAGFCAVCTLLFSFTLGLRSLDANIFGISLSAVSAMAVTLYMSRRHSLFHGLSAGILCGLAYSPLLAPSFAFAAVVSGMLWKVSVFFSSISAFVVGIAWALYAEGISALTGVMPSMLAASLFFAVVDKLYFGVAHDMQDADAAAADADKRESCCLLDKSEAYMLAIRDAEFKIRSMSEAFSSLSELFCGLSQRMRMPSGTDLKYICENAFDASCGACENRELCWENEYASTLSAVCHLSSELGRHGKVSLSDLPRRICERCSAAPVIIEQINRNGALHLKQLIEGDKTEIFALDYKSVSSLIEESELLGSCEYAVDSELTNRLCDALVVLSTEVGVVAVGEKGRTKVIVRSLAQNTLEEEKESILRIVSDICGKNMDIELFDDGRRAVIRERAIYRLEYAKRSTPSRDGDGFCGDTLSFFEGGSEHSYLLVSDGMGCGRDAAFTSGICSLFLSKMLGVTHRCDTALKMLNGFLRNKGSGSLHECSATVDLFEFDRMSGVATFYKGGAAPSYVWRGGNLFKIRSDTAPLGIINELEVNKITLEMSEGDIIVMVSDGVTRSHDECPWLFELLKESVESNALDLIAEKIVKRAEKEGTDDDISVVVARIAMEK